jgi:hypothetical protein
MNQRVIFTHTLACIVAAVVHTLSSLLAIIMNIAGAGPKQIDNTILCTGGLVNLFIGGISCFIIYRQTKHDASYRLLITGWILWIVLAIFLANILFSLGDLFDPYDMHMFFASLTLLTLIHIFNIRFSGALKLNKNTATDSTINS